MVRPRLGMMIAMLTVFTGCASGERPRTPPPGKGFIQPWRTLTSAWNEPELGQIVRPGAPSVAAPRVQLRYPIAVAARGIHVYIVDSGLQQILRYDRARETMSVFAPFRTLSADQSAGLYVGPDQSLLLADPGQRKVIYFDPRGNVRQIFADDLNLARPVGVGLIEGRGDVLVADGQFNRIVAFNSIGKTTSVLDIGGDAPTRRLSGMALGPDGLYLVDRGARAVVVTGLDGAPRYVLTDPLLSAPHSVAVDRDNRVFVSDEFDDTIKVFIERKLAFTFGGQGAAPGRFNRPAALAVDENLLYVADTLNGRVQVLQVVPQALQEGGTR